MNAGAAGRRFHPLRALAWALAAAVAFAFSFTPLRTSHDEFWMLKTGQWIAEHGHLPTNDIFTYTAENIPWDNHEWLTQLGLWKLWSAAESAGFGGWRAVILFKAILIVLAFVGLGWVAGRRLREPAWAALAAAMMAALGRRTFYPRPPFVSYLLLAVLLAALIEWRAGRLRGRWLWLLAPMFALWSNLHGAWMAGLIVIAAFWAEAALGAAMEWLAGARPADGWTRLKITTLLGVGCALATLANPYGWKLYLLPLRVAGDAYLAASIGELMPGPWFFLWIVPGTLLTLAAAALRPTTWRGALASLGVLALLGAGLWLSSDLAPWPGAHQNPTLQLALALPVLLFAAWRSGLPGWPALLLLMLFFTQQGLAHVRHWPLAALMILPVLAAALDGWAGALGLRLRRATPALNRAVATCVLAGLAGFWLFGARETPSFWQRDLMLARGTWMQPVPKVYPPAGGLPAPSTLPYSGVFMVDAYPVRAVDFLLSARLPGRLWNGGNYAGYLMWRLAPEKYKVFTDNRYDIYGGQFIRQEHAVLNGWDAAFLDRALAEAPAGDAERWHPWQWVLDHWDVQTLFLPADAAVNARLAGDAGWVRVYEDFDWIIWVRNTPTNAEAIRRALDRPRPTPWREVVSLDRGRAPNPDPARLGTMREALRRLGETR